MNILYPPTNEGTRAKRARLVTKRTRQPESHKLSLILRKGYLLKRGEHTER